MFYRDLPQLLTIQQASHLINVHPNTLRNWEKKGKISAIRIGSRRDRRFLQSDIWNLCRNNTNTHNTS